LGTTDLHPEAIILLASVKLLNGNEALSGEVGSFLKEIQVQMLQITKKLQKGQSQRLTNYRTYLMVLKLLIV
jgi:hypothetical protein